MRLENVVHFGLVIFKFGGVSVLHHNTGIILDLVNVDLIYYYVKLSASWARTSTTQRTKPSPSSSIWRRSRCQTTELPSSTESGMRGRLFSSVLTLFIFSSRKKEAMFRLETVVGMRPPLKLTKEGSVPFIEERLVKLYLGKNY